jgi:hypothetical protein
MKRKVLVILSDRLSPLRKPRYVEMVCDQNGTVFSERYLRGRPAAARYDEVWENDEGRKRTVDCHCFKRRYRHKFEKPKVAAKKRKR